MGDFFPLEPGKRFLAVRLLAILALVELVRNGVYFGFLNILALEHDSYSLAAVGIAASLHYGADTLLRGFGGFLTERFGVGRVLAISATLALAGFWGVLEASGPLQLWLTALIHGAALAPMWPGVMASIGRLALPGHQGRALGIAQGAVLPFLGGGFLVAGLLTRADPTFSEYFLTAGTVLALVMALSAVGFSPHLEAARSEPQARSFKVVLPLLPAAFAQTFAGGLLVPILFPYLDYLKAPDWVLLAGVAILGVVLYGSLQFTGHWVDRAGSRLPLFLGFGLTAMMLAIMAIPPQFYLMLLLLVSGGVGFALIMPGWNGLVIRLLPQKNLAGYWGILMTAEGIGTALGPAVATTLFEQVSFRAPFLIGAAIYIGIAIFYWFFLGRSSAVPEPP